jgi:hypothetical protein
MSENITFRPFTFADQLVFSALFDANCPEFSRPMSASIMQIFLMPVRLAMSCVS